MKTIRFLVVLLGLILTPLAPLWAQGVIQPLAGSEHADELTVEVPLGVGISHIHFYCYVPEINSFKYLGPYWLNKDWGMNTVTIDLNESRESYQPVFTTGMYFFDIITTDGRVISSPSFKVWTENCTIWIRPEELSKMVITNGLVPLRWEHFNRPGQEPQFDVCIKYRSLSCSNRADFSPGNSEPIFSDAIDWSVPVNAPQVGIYTYRISQIGRPMNYEEGTFTVDTNATAQVVLSVSPDSFPSDTGVFWIDMYPRTPSGEIRLQQPRRFWVLEFANLYPTFSVSGKIEWTRFSNPLPSGSYQVEVPKNANGFLFRAVEYRSRFYFPPR